MKNQFSVLLKTVLGAVAVVVLLFGGIALSAANQARQARFSVDALEQYWQAYKLVEEKSIERLSELPDFHLVSPSTGLSLESKNLKRGVTGGYVYDLQYLENDKFVISASPVGIFSMYEFGITDKGILRVNYKNVDAQADSYDEVEKWPIISREEKIRTKDFPVYQ